MRFSTTLLQMGNNTGIEVPSGIVTALGACKRAPMIVNILGVPVAAVLTALGG